MLKSKKISLLALVTGLALSGCGGGDPQNNPGGGGGNAITAAQSCIASSGYGNGSGYNPGYNPGYGYNSGYPNGYNYNDPNNPYVQQLATLMANGYTCAQFQNDLRNTGGNIASALNNAARYGYNNGFNGACGNPNYNCQNGNGFNPLFFRQQQNCIYWAVTSNGWQQVVQPIGLGPC